MLMQCNLVLCQAKEQQLYCLLQACEKNIEMKRKSRVCVFWILRSHLIDFQKSIEADDKEERFTTSNCECEHQPQLRGKNKS